MANDLQAVTKNTALDDWIDDTPGAASTGYQSQNVVIQALFNGKENITPTISGNNLTLAVDGFIDDSGLPFEVSTLITLALPTAGAANWYLKVVSGSTALERSIEFDDDRGIYDASKNGYYTAGGERVLNWLYNRIQNKLVKIEDSGNNNGDSVALANNPLGYIRRSDFFYRSLQYMHRRIPLAIDPNASTYDSFRGKIILLRTVAALAYIVNTDTGDIESTIDLSALGEAPYDCTYFPRGDNLIVQDLDGEVYVFNGISNSISYQFTLSGGVRDGMAVDNIQNMLVTMKRGSGPAYNPTIYLHDSITGSELTNFTMTDISLPNPSNLEVNNANGDYMIFSSNEIYIFDFTDKKVKFKDTMGAYASGGVAFDYENYILYCNSTFGSYKQGSIL